MRRETFYRGAFWLALFGGLAALSCGCTAEQRAHPAETAPSGGTAGPPVQTSPSAQRLQLTVRGADFEEDEANTFHTAEEGWRTVGVYLDVTYAGGLPDHRLCVGWRSDATLFALLNAPNGGTYELNETSTAAGLCLALAPGLNVRLYFEGDVPAALSTIAGSTVTVLINSGWASDPSRDPVFEATVPLEKGAAFAHAAAGAQTQPFGAPVRIPNGSFEVLSVALDESFSRRFARITYRVTNDSPYDLDSPIAEGMLVDARGYAYGLRLDECTVPPGYAEECATTTDPFDGPAIENPPSLTDVLVVLRREGLSAADPPDVFRGSQQ